MLLVAGLMTVGSPGQVGASTTGYRQVLPIVFPVAGRSTFRQDYGAWRFGGRRHQATDIFGRKLQPIHAAASGRVCLISGVDEAMPAYGYAIRVCGDDGRTYHYIHLNNDRPGTDDGRGGARWAYAPGLRVGSYVRRGQWIGYMGDSGNAERTPPHLHFEIRDRGLEDPRLTGSYRDPTRLDPFYSLVAARSAGRVPSGVLGVGSRGATVAAWQRQLRDRLGLSVAVDGVFGTGTLRATIRFQDASGIQVDGLVGPQTLARAGNPVGVDLLGARPAGDGATSYRRLLRLQRPYVRGDDVRTWQNWMRERGYRISVDGIYGPQSQGVARRLQQRAGLVVDGIVGPNTWAASRR